MTVSQRVSFPSARVYRSVCLALLAGSGALAHADDGADQAASRSLDQVVITADSVKGPDQAPSQGSLVATEPQSVIGGDFIQSNAAPAANYTDIIKFAPSVWTVDPNGAGLMENLTTSIRGFQDGQFNVTFDGIPWGDSNDFTHHSTSYFMAQDIGSVVVDRGPGNAATLGDATFGGTVAVQSSDPKQNMGISGELSDGSFNTRVTTARFDTGTISEWGNTRAYINAKTMSSDGYLSNSALDRSNVFFKIVQPIDGTTTITFASNLNKVKQNPPIGATYAQLQAYGVNYAYNANPASQSYYGYNVDKITTDYEYLGVNSQWDGWTLNNKLYTYAYYHDGWNGEDVNGQQPDGSLPNGDIPNGTLYSATDVPGQNLTNNYRSIGDIFRLQHDLGPGEAQIGGWYDHQTNFRSLIEIDLSDNNALNPAALGNTTIDAVDSADRIMHDQLFTEQGYLQYVWHTLPALDITGGLKFVRFERELSATVNQKTGQPLSYDETWTRTLPSLDAHYKFSDNWTAYAQWSKGFLAPNLNVLYTLSPAASTVQPEATTNVQAGTTWTNNLVSLSADVYAIDFNNQIGSRKENGITVFYNEGGTRYRGIEFEGTYVLGAGFSVYGNASWNGAHSTVDDTWVPDTPNRMAAIGLLYKDGPLQGSIIDKYVGMRYGDSENTQPLGGYATADAAINYTFLQSVGVLDNAKIGLTVQNLLNRTSIYYLNGYTAGNTPLYFTIPGRAVEVTLSAAL